MFYNQLHLCWALLALAIANRISNAIHMYSGITSGKVLDGELLYTKILEVNLFAMYRRLQRNLHETVCRQMQTKLNSYSHQWL